MKKIFALGLIAALSLALFAGCNGGNNEDPNKNKNNTEPTIAGVQDTATVMAGTEFNALEGVTATDKEDGDLTSKITVESEPALTFTNGKATPAATGEYEIIYSVKDSGGLEGNAYCTLTVTPAAAEETTLKEYKDFNVADRTLDPEQLATEDGVDEAALDYWRPHLDTAEGIVKQSKGALVFDITNRNNAGDGSIRLSRTMNDLTEGKFTFMVWAKSSVTTYVNMLAIDKTKSEWTPVSEGAYNKELGTELTVLKHEFTIDDSNMTSSVEFRLHMGKDGGLAEDKTMPDVYTISIYKVALYQTTGQNKTTELYTSDFTSSVSNVTIVNAGDDAVATVEHDATENAAKVNVTAYNNTTSGGGIWSIAPGIALTGATVEAEAKYGYELVLKAQTAIPAIQVLIENEGGRDSNNREFKETAVGTTDTTISGEFVSKFSAAKPTIFLNMGKTNDGPDVTSNVLWIKSVRFFKIEAAAGSEAEKTVNKCNSYFAQKKGTDDVNYPFDFFNGSDEGSNTVTPGLSTFYTEGGNLVYHVLQGSSTDWHNKLVVGYGENGLALPGNSYYTIRIKIKADKALTCPVIALHEIDTDWDLGMIKKAENVAIGTDWTTIEIKVEEAFIGEKNAELLFQFGSQAFEALGEVKIEIAEITILQSELVG